MCVREAIFENSQVRVVVSDGPGRGVVGDIPGARACNRRVLCGAGAVHRGHASDACRGDGRGSISVCL